MLQVLIKLHNDEEDAAIAAAQGRPDEAVWQIPNPAILPAAGLPATTVLTSEQVNRLAMHSWHLFLLLPPTTCTDHPDPGMHASCAILTMVGTRSEVCCAVLPASPSAVQDVQQCHTRRPQGGTAHHYVGCGTGHVLWPGVT